MQSATITPINAAPVQWWQKGVPGYVVAHPFPVGAVVAGIGWLAGSRVLTLMGLAYASYGVIQLAVAKAPTVKRMYDPGRL
jgi:hypothetical protein